MPRPLLGETEGGGRGKEKRKIAAFGTRPGRAGNLYSAGTRFR